jgi:hypothetical protein
LSNKSHFSRERSSGAAIAEQERAEGGRIGDWFGTKHQLSNILAIVSVALVAMIFMSIAGAIWQNNLEFFKTIGLALLSTLTTIIGFLVGQRTVPPKE